MASVASFNTFLQQMAELDVFTGVLPFVVTYIVFFKALEEAPVIGDGENKVPALLAIAFAFFVARFIALNPVYQSFFLGFFGKLTIGLMGFIGLFVLLAFTNVNLNGGASYPIVIMVMIIIVGAAFTTSGGFGAAFGQGLQGSSLMSQAMTLFNFTLDSGLIWIILVAGALFWVSKEDSPREYNPAAPFFNPKFWTRLRPDSGGGDEPSE